MNPPDLIDWLATIAVMVIWAVLLSTWFRYQARKRQQWLRRMKEHDENFINRLKEIDSVVANVDRDLAYYHLYKILTNEDDDQVYHDALVFLKERTKFFKADSEGRYPAALEFDENHHYTAREVMALPREQRDAIMEKAAQEAADTGLYSEEWYANEKIPNEDEADETNKETE